MVSFEMNAMSKLILKKGSQKWEPRTYQYSHDYDAKQMKQLQLMSEACVAILFIQERLSNFLFYGTLEIVLSFRWSSRSYCSQLQKLPKSAA